MVSERSFGGVGGVKGCLQYVELFKGSDCMLKCWRLKDYKNPFSEWSLVYNVSRVDVVVECLDFDKVKLISLHLPFEPDSALFSAGEYIFSFNFRTLKVEGCVNFSGHVEFMFIPFVLPRWPTSIPPRFYASCAKEEGNIYFKVENFAEAIKCYSKSIALAPTVAAYTNCAMAYLKTKRFREAEVDCTEALKIDTNHVKGYVRRAIARKELGYMEGSKEDAEFALKLEPSNRAVKNLYADVKSLIVKRSSTEGSRELDMADFQHAGFDLYVCRMWSCFHSCRRISILHSFGSLNILVVDMRIDVYAYAGILSAFPKS